MKYFKKFTVIVGFIIGASMFLGTCNAYFVKSFNPNTHLFYDGFGRPLYNSPMFIRFILGQEKLWAGWFWFIGDIVIFWAGIGIAWLLIDFGWKESKKLGN